MLNLRTLLGIPIAAAITLGLFVFMRSLVAYEGAIPEDTTPTHVVVIGRTVTDSETQEDEIETIIEEPVDELPPLDPDWSPSDDENTETISLDPTGDKIEVDVNGPEVCGQPIIRIAPQYPRRAMEGIEGWVLIGFTVARDGTTKDVHVIDEEPKGVFGREAVKAVERWKYKPCVVDGKVSEVKLQVVLSFELDN